MGQSPSDSAKLWHGCDLSDDLHEALDTILNEGTPDAIGSIEFDLLRTTKEQIDLARTAAK